MLFNGMVSLKIISPHKISGFVRIAQNGTFNIVAESKQEPYQNAITVTAPTLDMDILYSLNFILFHSRAAAGATSTFVSRAKAARKVMELCATIYGCHLASFFLYFFSSVLPC
jgi:hypothetical protein